MTLSQAQLREAAHLIHEMLSDFTDSWMQRHLLVWRSAK